MRLLIFDLRPPILEQVGLVAALQARLNAVEGRANLQTRLIADELANLPSLAEQALYRIAQEALNNALKHARAQHITVQLCDCSVVLALLNGGQHECSKGIHVLFFHATRRDRRGAQTDSRGIHRFAGVIGDHVLVQRNTNSIQHMLHLSAAKAPRRHAIDQHEVIVGAVAEVLS
jgi:hypothetical protein